MPNIVEENRYAKPSFARSIAGGLAQGLPEAIRGYQENQALKKNYGVELTGITDPNTRQQIIAQELMYGRKRRAAEASRDVSYTPRDQQDSSLQGSPEVKELPMPKEERPSPKQRSKEDPLARTFKKSDGLPQKTTGIPESRLSETGISSSPQFETSGQKFPVLDPRQIDQEVDRVMTENNSNPNNYPMDQTQARAKVIARNNENIVHNSRVEADQVQKQNFQTAWGKNAVEKLANVMEKPTDEMKAIMMRKGEEIATDPKYNKDQSSMNAQLTIEAANLKNMISNAENGIKAPRALQKGKESLLGTQRSDKGREEDTRVAIKPLLEQGMFDTTRKILSGKGWGPEETENLITTLGEGTKKSIAEFPKVGAEKKPVLGKFGLKDKSMLNMVDTYNYSPEQEEQIVKNIEKTILADPSVNLLLLRRDLRAKNVDWQIYKDTINNLVLTGQFKPNPDQANHMNALEQPPLDALDKITESLNIIGR